MYYDVITMCNVEYRFDMVRNRIDLLIERIRFVRGGEDEAFFKFDDNTFLRNTSVGVVMGDRSELEDLARYRRCDIFDRCDGEGGGREVVIEYVDDEDICILKIIATELREESSDDKDNTPMMMMNADMVDEVETVEFEWRVVEVDEGHFKR